MFIVDKIHSVKRRGLLNCCNYNTWNMLAWWLYIKFGLSYRCNPYVCVSCMRV